MRLCLSFVQRQADEEPVVDVRILADHVLRRLHEISAAPVPVESRSRVPADWSLLGRLDDQSVVIHQHV
jgi:hypothetical protein